MPYIQMQTCPVANQWGSVASMTLTSLLIQETMAEMRDKIKEMDVIKTFSE